MVVFAVLVALGVEEWRDEAQLREFAARAEEAVVAEVRANLEEFRTTGPALEASMEKLAEALRESDISLLNGAVGLELPDFSSSAWRATQSSQAAPYLDYEWVIQVSRAYETYDLYSRIADRVIDALSLVIGGGPTLESIQAVQGHLVILNGVHGQVMERLEGLLESRP